MIYKKRTLDSKVYIIRFNDNGTQTGCTEGTNEYEEYLEWVEAGNTADSVDDTKTWSQIRADRDLRLKETDWTQTPDVPQETIWKWKTYRQDLRDIPQKQTDPTNITWPTKPS